MRFVKAGLIAAALALQVASAQDGARSAPGRPNFEVASIKPIPPDAYLFDPKHPGIKIDGQIAEFGSRRVRELIAWAFHIEDFQVIGPKEIDKPFYTIQAKMPAGATTGQVPDMLVQLLVERFHMEFHKDTKEFSVLALIVDP